MQRFLLNRILFAVQKCYSMQPLLTCVPPPHLIHFHEPALTCQTVSRLQAGAPFPVGAPAILILGARTSVRCNIASQNT